MGHDDKAEMTYAGRIYQNPHDKKEIWINVGWFGYDYTDENTQVYPDYDDKLAEYVPYPTYNDLMEFLKDQLVQNKPCMDGGCAWVICCCTCGVCYLPIFFVKQKYKSSQKRMIDAFKRQNIDNQLEVSIRFVKESEPHRSTDISWRDSTGKELILLNGGDAQKISGAAGPPPGINMVFKLPGEIPWPSSVTNIVPYQNPLSVPQPAGTTTIKHQQAPPTNIITPYQNPVYPVYPPSNVQPMYPPPVENVPLYPPPVNNVPLYPPPVDAPPAYAPPSYVQTPQGNIDQQPATTEHIFCGECGTKSSGSKFCTSCGAHI